VLRRGEQKVAEATQHKGTDCPLLVVADPKIVQLLSGKDIEMVEPEIDHDLLQLAPAQYRPEDSRLRRLADDGPGARLPGLDEFGGQLEAADGRQRPVKLAQLNSVVL
jgi:hypothetical protein